MANKIIFTDVDGVLNCAKTTRRLKCWNCMPFVDARKVLRLRDIVERTGAQLVLSSSWRVGRHEKAMYLDRMALIELEQEFKRLRCPVWIDCTPLIPFEDREVEVQKWLSQHPEVDKFVILDDVWEEFPNMREHLVATTERDGLNKERAELVVKMLGEK